MNPDDLLNLTPEEFARLAREQSSGGATRRGGESLQMLSSGPRPNTVLCFPAMTGDVSCYADLARNWEGTLESCALDPLALWDKLGTQITLEDMADRCEQLITQFHDISNVGLCGWSFGGLLAHAVAALCEKRGQKPRFVCLIDTTAPTAGVHGKIIDMLAEGSTFAMFARDFLGRGDPHLSYDQVAGLSPKARISHLNSSLSSQKRTFSELELTHFLERYVSNVRAGWRYTVPIINTPLLVFRSEQRPSPSDYAEVLGDTVPYREVLRNLRLIEDTPSLGWHSSTTLQVTTLGGNHYTITKEPYSKMIAASVRNFLDASTSNDFVT